MKKINIYEWLAEAYTGIASPSQINKWKEQGKNPVKARIEILDKQRDGILNFISRSSNDSLDALAWKNIAKIDEQLLQLKIEANKK